MLYLFSLSAASCFFRINNVGHNESNNTDYSQQIVKLDELSTFDLLHKVEEVKDQFLEKVPVNNQ